MKVSITPVASPAHLYDGSWQLPVGCEQPSLEAIGRDAKLPEAVGFVPRTIAARPVGKVRPHLVS
jgi:hypothetical protein